MTETSREGKLPPPSLPDELLHEILARVPYRSLCRFRCVSPSWRALCSDPGILRRSPQTFSGFFCYALDDIRDARFLNFPGRSGGRRPLVDPSFPFLRDAGYAHDFIILDCGGLLLCECFTSPTPSSQLDSDYVVCNPATEDWTVLPRTEELHPRNIIRLGFDPAAPSRFAVFVLLQDLDNGGELTGVVEIYSSETGLWTSRLQVDEWGQGTAVDGYYGEDSVSVFLNGILHLSTDHSSIVTVDMDGKTLAEFGRPFSGPGYIGQSQGRLHAIEIVQRFDGCCLLAVWVLEDYASGDWTMKQAENILELLGREICKKDESYTFIAIHPECDIIFFMDGVEERLMSYDMDSKKVHVVYNKGEHYLPPYLPYTPCFAEWLPTR
ncbi:unnamed protein product [Alopecurus aequalis]